MSLADVIRSGVATIDSVTAPLQAAVVHRAWIGQNEYGDDVFATPVSRLALVDRTSKPMFTRGGQQIMTLATITFVHPVPPTTPNANQTRVNPIDPRDVLTMDDGATGPIIAIKGFEDAGLGAGTPFVSEVTLGAA